MLVALFAAIALLLASVTVRIVIDAIGCRRYWDSFDYSVAIFIGTCSTVLSIASVWLAHNVWGQL
jgi:hypothetical protein